MFTTISKLLASNAEKTRVNQLDRALKKINPNWQGDYLIPIPAVGLDNVLDDVRWVQAATDTHVTTEMDDEIQSLLAQNSLDNYVELMSRGKQAAINKVMAVYNQVASRRNISSELLTNPIVAFGKAKYRKVEAVSPAAPVEETPAAVQPIATLNELVDNAPAGNLELPVEAEIDHSFFIDALTLMPTKDLEKILSAVGKERGMMTSSINESGVTNINITLNK